VPERQFTDAELHAALGALTPERFRAGEGRIARIAPQLQRILAQVLHEGGWFDEAHDAAVLKTATTPNEDERLTAVRTLLAEETRTAMLVGVAVGWELARQLEGFNADDTENDTEGD
jgi:hypothetical protein